MTVMIHVRELSKSFTLHNQGGIQLPVLNRVNLQIKAGECTVLHGESGAGKSTLLRTLYANYLAGGGDIEIRHHDEMVNLVSANSQTLLAIRRDTLGYVSQFLRVIPRVTTLEVVKQPLKERGIEDTEAEARACELLARLNIPQRLWSLPPGTFSGGEQQRVNIARGFIHNYPILLLDEPTASLDKRNSEVVIELIHEALARNTAIVGIFHDESVREAVADHYFDVNRTPDLPIDNERGAILP